MKSLTVFAAGAGGSGSPVIMQLALLGVGTIIICDFDNIELSNLNRQVLHDESRIGINKAESAALSVQRINPNVNVIVRKEKIDKDTVFDLVSNSAIIFDNVDSIDAKFALSECAVAKRIPHVLSSMIERSSYAVIFHTPYTPCFHCCYDKNKLDVVRELRKEDSGWNKVANCVASPALFLSAGFAVNEAIKIVLGFENPSYNKYFFFNNQSSERFSQTRGYKIVTYPFSRHFIETCKKNGFDWEKGFTGRFIEEIEIEKDPNCPLCSSLQDSKGLTGSKRLASDAPVCDEPNIVALLISHSIRMVIGIMGVLKSGNPFVTLDPEYPEDRLKYILDDTNAHLIITDDENEAMATKISSQVNKNIKIFNINEINQYNKFDENKEDKPGPDQLSYIMYTSGSMGHPKGVMQKHKNVLHFIMNYTNGLHIGKDDRLSLIPSFSFSAAMMDVFAALSNGATLCLYNIKEDGPQKLAGWLNDNNITIYHSVPTVFRHFVASIENGTTFPKLRIIDFGGEPVSSLDVDSYKKYFTDDCVLVNGLGATELNVIRQYPINKNTKLTGNLVPVGYKVRDTEILLIDEAGNPVKYNRPGEIVIKSAYLSPGYWGLNDQTEKSFKENPSGGPERLYFTGDLGRLRTDGCLEHLGRRDLQLKIKGIRIESSEIETVMLGIPGIKEAVVMAEEKKQGEKQLVSYFVPDNNAETKLSEIVDSLKERLPEYMIPVSFIRMNSMPLTLTGKVDRKKLKSHDGLSLSRESKYTAPGNDTEKKLISIWQTVMKLEQIGIYDDFFQIGGDSLTGLRVIDMAHHQGLMINPRDLSRNPTIAQLAMLADEKKMDSNKKVTIPERDKTEIERLIPLSYNQFTFFDSISNRINPARYNMSRLLEIDFPLEHSYIKQVFSYLLDCHEVLKARFVNENGIWKQYIKNSVEDIPFETFDFSDIKEDEQKSAIETAAENIQNSLDITNGPLIRIAYFNMGKDRSNRFFMVAHHLICDITSLTIFLNDFLTAYQQLLQTGKIALPREMTTFSDYTTSLNSYYYSEELESEAGYWLNLPWDKVANLTPGYPIYSKKITEGSLKKYTIALSVSETQKLLKDTPSYYHTSSDNLLMVTLVESVGKWLNKDWIFLESTDSGRLGYSFTKDMDLSRTVGFIVTSKSFVIKRFDKNTGQNDLIHERVKFVDEQIKKTPNQGLGLVLLSRLGDKNKEPIKNIQIKYPGCQLLFNFLGRIDNDVPNIRIAKENPGMRARPDEAYFFPLECICFISQEKLFLQWVYSSIFYQQSVIEDVAGNYLTLLKIIIEEVK